jgi:hypothetical protein
MATCATATPLGEYGGDTYGEGISPCDSSNPVGYGDGVDPCNPTTGDSCLVGIITKLAEKVWVGHRSARFGNDSFQADNYPECKRLVQLCVARNLVEERVAQPGRPLIVYLRLPGNCS